MLSKEDFWLKNDLVSMARSLRLAVIQNLYDSSKLTKTEAQEVLTWSLTPGDDMMAFDDSDCLNVSSRQKP